MEVPVSETVCSEAPINQSEMNKYLIDAQQPASVSVGNSGCLCTLEWHP